jgi:PAS domain-containing protein
VTDPSMRRGLRLIDGELEADSWTWFCGHCAAPSPDNEPPAPNARVCPTCSMGLLLEARAEAAPEPGAAFLVVDSQLRIQAVSTAAEELLGVREELTVNKPLAELIVPADAEADGQVAVGALLARAASDVDAPTRAFVRPANTFGVRIRARIAPCGPPRAALIVLDSQQAPQLRAV